MSQKAIQHYQSLNESVRISGAGGAKLHHEMNYVTAETTDTTLIIVRWVSDCAWPEATGTITYPFGLHTQPSHSSTLVPVHFLSSTQTPYCHPNIDCPLPYPLVVLKLSYAGSNISSRTDRHHAILLP